MSLELTCPVCLAINAFAPAQGGRMGKCGKCHTPLYVPRREELPPLPADTLLGGRPRSGLRWAVAAATAVVLLSASVGGYFLFFGKKESAGATAGPPPRPPSRDVGGDFATALAIKLSPAGAHSLDEEFETASDEDMFKFTAPVSGTLVVGFESAGNKLDGRLIAYDAARKEVAQNDIDPDKRVPEILFPAVKDQQYFVKASCCDARATGKYKLTFATVTDVGNDFTSAFDVKLSRTGYAVQSWKIDPAGDVDFFRVVPPQGGILVVELSRAAGSSLDSVLSAYDHPTRPPVLQDSGKDTSSPRLMRLPVEGGKPYFLKVAAYQSAPLPMKTGAYTLTYRLEKAPPDDYGNTFADAFELKMFGDGSAFQSGRIDPLGDVDYFRFKASVSGKVTAELRPGFGSNLACALIAYDAGQKELARQDFGGASVVSFFVEAGKNYYLKAAASATAQLQQRTGPYSLDIRTLKSFGADGSGKGWGGDLRDARELALQAVGETKHAGTIVSVGAVDSFRIKAAVSGFLVAEVRAGPGSLLGCRLQAYDSTKGLLTQQDNGYSSILRFRVQAGKTYYLQAGGTTQAFGGAKTGAYALGLYLERDDRASDFTAAAKLPISENGFASRSDWLDTPGTARYYKVQAPVSGLVAVELTPPPGSFLETRLTLYDANRKVIRDEDQPPANVVQFSAVAGETYYLKAAASAQTFVATMNKTGQYTLTLRTGKSLADDYGNDFDKAHEIAVPDSGLAKLTGRIEVFGDVDCFAFEAPVTGLVTVKLVPAPRSRLDTYLRVYDANRFPIASDDQGPESFVQFKAEAGKTYYLKAAASSQPFMVAASKVGDYALTVRTGKALADDFGNDFDKAHEIKLSVQGAGTQRGRIEVFGDVDCFRLAVPVGGKMTVDMLPAPNSRLFANVSVYNADKQPVSVTYGQFSVQAGETYYLKASARPANWASPSMKVGAYVIQVRTSPGF